MVIILLPENNALFESVKVSRLNRFFGSGIRLFFGFIFLFGSLQALTHDPYISASVDSGGNIAHFPLQGTLTVTHDENQKVDSQSAIMEGKKLEISFIKEVKMSAGENTVISIYSFQMPEKEKGTYLIPSISLKIDDQLYHSLPATYEVVDTSSESHNIFSSNLAPASSFSSSDPVVFKLEGGVQGPSTLYLGERTKLVYRISFNRSIDLTRSTLPMVHPAHFKKIGDVQVKDSQIGELSIQELTQEIEASELGTFSFGPSSIEGYAYTMQQGKKIYSPNVLKSEVPPITIVVSPIPQAERPSSLTNALGKIEVSAKLITPNTIAVGDIVHLQVSVQGIKNLQEMHFPSLACQPGFSGFFQMNSFPPLAEVKDGVKYFNIELRPLTSLVTQIPSIELSSFDPERHDYVIQHTSPLPVSVHDDSSFGSIFVLVPPIVDFNAIDEHWPVPQLPPLELTGAEMNELKTTSYMGAPLSIRWILSLLFLAFFLLYAQKEFSKWYRNLFQSKSFQNEQLFKTALKSGSLNEIEKAFWCYLWEKGFIAKNERRLELLPEEEGWMELRDFLFYLQVLQYSENRLYDRKELETNARKQFETLKSLK